jgi:hypothetical protein
VRWWNFGFFRHGVSYAWFCFINCRGSDGDYGHDEQGIGEQRFFNFLYWTALAENRDNPGPLLVESAILRIDLLENINQIPNQAYNFLYTSCTSDLALWSTKLI